MAEKIDSTYMDVQSNKWDERFRNPEYLYGTEPNDFLKANGHYFKDGTVLSLAEGEGRNAVFLASVAKEVTGVDSSAVGLEKARRLAAQKGVAIHTVHADLSEYEIEPGKYSGIVAIFCHLPSAQRRVLHEKCAAALRPGGIFLLEGYVPRQLEYKTGGPPDEDKMHSLAELREAFAGWEALHGTELVRTIHEGLLHHGEGAVVQFIARKPG